MSSTTGNFTNGYQCVGTQFLHKKDFLARNFAVDSSADWSYGAGAPEGGFQGINLMDRAMASCELQMANNGLENTQDYCCQVHVYVGLWGTPTASKWQDGEYVAVAEVFDTTKTQFKPFDLTVEGDLDQLSYFGAFTKTQYLAEHDQTEVVEESAEAPMVSPLAAIAETFNFLI